MLLDSDHAFPEVCRASATIDLQRIRSNFTLIRQKAQGLPLLPMIKANAYGHGAIEVARALLDEGDRLAGFGVATPEEGAELRAAVPPAIAIHVFSGCAPWTPTMNAFCKRHKLTPVLHRLEDLRTFLQSGDAEHLEYEIKFDTGMNRLGIPWDCANDVQKLLQPLTPHGRPRGIVSHLAVAENPSHALSRLQLKRIESLHGLFRSMEGIRSFHYSNSAAIWNAKAWKISRLSTAVRPGLSLYGVPPWKGASNAGLELALHLRFQVLRRMRVDRGEWIGYGAAFRHRGSRPLEVAVIGGGYSDGILRSNAGKGDVSIAGRDYPFLGRISMDLSAIRCPRSLRVGDWVTSWGSGIDPWKQAEKAGTLPYELLTSIGSRVLRIYDVNRAPD